MWPEDGFGGAGESALVRSAHALVREGDERSSSGGHRRRRDALADRVRGPGAGGLGLRGLLWPVRTAAQGSLGPRHLDERAAVLHPGQGVVPALGIALDDGLRERRLGARVIRE